jgi:hypothetical protein
MKMNFEPQSGHLLEISIRPTVENDDFFYKVFVFDVHISSGGEMLREIRDILHFDTLKVALEYLARWSREGDSN